MEKSQLIGVTYLFLCLPFVALGKALENLLNNSKHVGDLNGEDGSSYHWCYPSLPITFVGTGASAQMEAPIPYA